MRRVGLVTIALLVLMLETAPAALAQQRVALVIGNSAYQHTPRLTNPKNDALDMAAMLKKHGFQVIEGFDLDKTAFDRKVRDFSAALRGVEVGLFFYAGHGLQVDGQNYLVPVDAKAETEDALDWEMLKVQLVHRAMERSTSTNLLFLDACRDNPLARNLARSMGTRSAAIGRGLAVVESGIGTLISFSTQPGNVALDGMGRNSPFTEALVKQLAISNDDLGSMLIAVRTDVVKMTQGKQVPWEHSALMRRFYFGPGTSPPVAPTWPNHISEAADAWDKVKDTQSIAALDAFIRRFGDTFYADLAKVRLAELKQTKLPREPTVVAKENADDVSRALGSLSAQDRQLARKAQVDALERGKPGQPIRWRNWNNGSYGEVVADDYHELGGARCRTFVHNVWIDGRRRNPIRGTACRYSDGAWTPKG